MSTELKIFDVLKSKDFIRLSEKKREEYIKKELRKYGINYQPKNYKHFGIIS